MNPHPDPAAHDAPTWTTLGLLVPGADHGPIIWAAHFHPGEEPKIYTGDFAWNGLGETAQGATETTRSPAAPAGDHEGTAEAEPTVPSPHQAGPTRPGGPDEAAHSVTAGRDRQHFLPEGTGPHAMAHEPRREPMLLWRAGDHSVIRQPAPAARELGPCPPVYFRSLAPYRPNRAERGLRLLPSSTEEGPKDNLSHPNSTTQS